MSIRTFASLLLATALAAPLLQAQDQQPPAPATPPASSGTDAPKTALAKDMDQIGHAFRKLRKQISDPTQNASSLELVGTIHDAAVAASKETPAWTADQPAAQQAEFVANFQASMKEFIGSVDQLSAALKTNDNTQAAKLLANLGHLEHTDHKKYRKPEQE
jgi:soluble cytochrome b562